MNIQYERKLNNYKQYRFFVCTSSTLILFLNIYLIYDYISSKAYNQGITKELIILIFTLSVLFLSLFKSLKELNMKKAYSSTNKPILLLTENYFVYHVNDLKYYKITWKEVSCLRKVSMVKNKNKEEKAIYITVFYNEDKELSILSDYFNESIDLVYDNMNKLFKNDNKDTNIE